MTATIQTTNVRVIESQVRELEREASANMAAMVKAARRGADIPTYWWAVKSVVRNHTELTVAQVSGWYVALRADIVADQSIGIDLDRIALLHFLARVGRFLETGSSISDDVIIPMVRNDLRAHGWQYPN